MGVSEDLIPIVQEQICLLYKFFKEKDVTMLEINPLVETSTSEGFMK